MKGSCFKAQKNANKAIVMENGSAQIINLEHWMTNLPDQLKDVPFIYLAIPGSHDSMTYGITRSSELAPDADPILHRLYPLFRGTIIRWTLTQAKDTMQQLHLGIRYFDLRVATKKGDDNIYFTHGLYAGEISEPLKQIKSFMETHPGEVVILDFQHFYDFKHEHHQRLIRLLLNLYGPLMVPRQMDLERITLNSLNRLRQQIVIVYRDYHTHDMDQFWRAQMLSSPWPRQERAVGLRVFLEGLTRARGAGFVHQAVLTPTTEFILFRWRSTLRNKCALPVKNEVLPYIARDFAPGVPPPPRPPSEPLNGTAPVNVVIADFIEMDDAVFPKTIIQLNLKLLKGPDTV